MYFCLVRFMFCISLIIGTIHEVLAEVFRFPESILGAIYVVGKGIDTEKLEVNPKDGPRGDCYLKYKWE